MSEPVPSLADVPASTSDASLPMSAGAMVRKAREAAGLHIGALAVLLRVPVKKLEALEADRFDLLPDVVFVRALAASVCRNLNIDPLPVLAKLPQTATTRLRTDESGINVTFRSGVGGSGSLFWDQFSRPVVLVGFALLIGALLWAFYVYSDRSGVTQATKPELAAAMPALAVSAAASGSVVATVTSAPETVMPPAENAAQVLVAGSGATTGTVVFKAHGASWVEVVDGAGVVQLRKMLSEGETDGVSGVMPLAVVVGRADVTEVQVHGKPFDLTPMTKDKVARFEVKQ
jgi:cytoskeleton protein RodZ